MKERQAISLGDAGGVQGARLISCSHSQSPWEMLGDNKVLVVRVVRIVERLVVVKVGSEDGKEKRW